LVIIDGESAVMELDSESTPEEAELLNLLVGGATDEQAGASGWFELGVRAAQRGWVR
jgi:hypothetical protein